MRQRIQIVGGGMLSALGRGPQQHLAALARGCGLYRKERIDALNEAIEVPLLRIAELDAAPEARFYQAIDGAVRDAFADAGVDRGAVRGMPLFIGSSGNHIEASELRYRAALLDQAEGRSLPGVAMALPEVGFADAGRYLRQEFGLSGPDYACNTACTSSANALLMAASMIESGRTEFALVVGVETANVTASSGFYGMQLLAPGPMKPFDRHRNGLVLGEGCAALLLRGVEAGAGGLMLAGGASRCDIHSISASNPDGSEIAAVMVQALVDAGIEARDVQAIKAHATASPLNDDGEAAGLRRVFDEIPPLCGLKPYIGHTLGACGAAETLLFSWSLEQGILPATPGFEHADPELAVEPLREARRIGIGGGHFMLNTFGFGGNNCSLILEQC